MEDDMITSEDIKSGLKKLVEIAKKSSDEDVALALAVMLKRQELHTNIKDLLSHFAEKEVSNKLLKLFVNNYKAYKSGAKRH